MATRLDPYSVRLFVATARAGSIVRAAEQTHIAASALSRRLSDLEHVFGTPLMVRSPRGISLTDAGRLVLERGESLDEALQALVREVQAQGAEVRGTVRVYANMSSVIGFLPERLARFKALHPQVTVSLHEEDTRDVIRACLDDRADVGLGAELPAPPGLNAWHFADDPLCVLLPLGHPLAARAALTLADVLDQPVIGVHQGGTLDRQLHERAAALGRHLVPAMSVRSFDAAARMVDAGLGLAVLPQSAAAGYAGAANFVRLPLDEPWARRSLHLYALHRVPQPRVVIALLDCLRAGT